MLHCLPWGFTRMLPTLIKRSLWDWWRTCSILLLATQLSYRRGFQCSMSCAHSTCVICSKSSKLGRANITYHIKSNISKIFGKAETTQQQHPRQYSAIWGKRWCNKDQECQGVDALYSFTIVVCFLKITMLANSRLLWHCQSRHPMSKLWRLSPTTLSSTTKLSQYFKVKACPCATVGKWER